MPARQPPSPAPLIVPRRFAAPNLGFADCEARQRSNARARCRSNRPFQVPLLSRMFEVGSSKLHVPRGPSMLASIGDAVVILPLRLREIAR